MPDGAVHVLPYQCSGHGTVRTHADHRGPGGVCELPRRMHGADPGHESAARRGRRTDRPRRCGDQVFHDPELVPRRQAGEGRDLQLRHEAGKCLGVNSKISWTQVETGSSITWKYPSCILQGDNSVGEFYSVALANNYQQADTGTKMLHIGKNTRSTIISKGISAGYGRNTYRGRVQIHKGATSARNYSQCDSLLIGSTCAAFTFPDIQVQEPTAQMEHEASTSKIGEAQLFYCQTRGITPEEATNMIVNGFCKQVFLKLPMEFAVEAQKLISVSLNLEGTVG